MECNLEILCSDRINFLFSIVSWISIIVCLIPMLFPNFVGRLQAPENSNITTALLSTQSKAVLIVSLCLTGPLFIDLIMRAIMSTRSRASRKSLAPLAILLLSLVVPDVALLVPVVARLGYEVYNFTNNVRFILAVWSALSLMNGLSSNIWNKKSALSLYIIVNISVVINHYLVFFKIDVLLLVMELIIGILSMVTIYMLIRISFRWYTYVYHSTKTNVLTTEQYLGSIYMSSLLLLFLWSFATFFFSMGGTKWYDANTLMVILQEMKYTVFYVMLIVFKNRALHRDMTMTKVGTNFFSTNSIYLIDSYIVLSVSYTCIFFQMNTTTHIITMPSLCYYFLIDGTQ